jgi:hypothetical protein
MYVAKTALKQAWKQKKKGNLRGTAPLWGTNPLMAEIVEIGFNTHLSYLLER